MIAFGTFVAEDEAYRRYTEPGIRRAAEPDSAILAYASVTSLPRSLNIILDAAARHDDLEALVLLHPHTELTDPGALRAGARDAGRSGRRRRGRGGRRAAATGIAWWEGAVSAAPGTLALRRLRRRRRVPRRSAGPARRRRSARSTSSTAR